MSDRIGFLRSLAGPARPFVSFACLFSRPSIGFLMSFRGVSNHGCFAAQARYIVPTRGGVLPVINLQY